MLTVVPSSRLGILEALVTRLQSAESQLERAATDFGYRERLYL